MSYYPYGTVAEGVALSFTRPPAPQASIEEGIDLKYTKTFTEVVEGINVLATIARSEEVFEFPSLLVVYDTADGLGGAATTMTATQTAEPMRPIAGVGILASRANEVGIGVLSITKAGGEATLTWKCHGGYAPVSRVMTASGKLELITIENARGGSLLVDVNITTIEAGDYEIVVENVQQSVIPNITEAEAVSGTSKYIGLVVENINPVLTYGNAFVHVTSQPISGVEVLVGVGEVNVTGEVIADNGTEPSEINFNKKVLIAPMPPQATVALWVYVRVPPSAAKPLVVDLSRITIEAKL